MPHLLIPKGIAGAVNKANQVKGETNQIGNWGAPFRDGHTPPLPHPARHGFGLAYGLAQSVCLLEPVVELAEFPACGASSGS